MSMRSGLTLNNNGMRSNPAINNAMNNAINSAIGQPWSDDEQESPLEMIKPRNQRPDQQPAPVVAPAQKQMRSIRDVKPIPTNIGHVAVPPKPQPALPTGAQKRTGKLSIFRIPPKSTLDPTAVRILPPPVPTRP